MAPFGRVEPATTKVLAYAVPQGLDPTRHSEVGTPIDADVLKYHVIEGKKTMDALNSDQKTLNGGTLTAYRKFRKNWLDGAIIGLKSEGPSKSSNWPSDVECDNGIIHAIDTVLVPGAYEGSR